MFGKGNFSEGRYEAWEEKMAAMLAKVRAGQIKLIMVSRTHIFQHCRDKLSQNKVFEDLGIVQLQDGTCWNASCEIEVLQALLKWRGVESEVPVSELRNAYSCQSIGFPQCCSYFASNAQAQKLGVKFFQNPLAFLQKEIKAMKKSDKRAYFVLILTLKHNGHLSETFLSSDSSRTSEELLAVGNLCGLKPALTVGEVRETADSLCGVYLTKSYDGDGYRLFHWSLSDCLFVEMCQTDLKHALEVCSLSQLFEYIRTENCLQNEGEIICVVHRGQWPTLASRLVKELISTQHLPPLLHHPCLQDDEFMKALVKSIESDDSKKLLGKVAPGAIGINSIAVLNFNTALSVIIAEGKTRLARHLMLSDAMKALSDAEKLSLLQEALTAACYRADVSLVRQLLSRGATASEEAGRAICLSPVEKVELLKKVFPEIPAVEKKPEFFGDLAMLCCLTDKTECLRYLLHDAPRPRNFQTTVCSVMNALLQETHPRNIPPMPPPKCLTELFEELKSEGARVSSTIPVTVAAGHPNSFVLRELINGGADFEMADGKGVFPLMSASATGSEACVEAIVEAAKKKGAPLDVNCRDPLGRTPLHAAARRNHAAILNILLHNGADPNVTNNFDMLPLHMCTAYSPEQDVSVLTCLLEKTDDPLHQDCLGKTPLHYAAEKGDYSGMEVLLASDLEREKKGLQKACDVEDIFKQHPLHIYCHQSHNRPVKAVQRRQVERLLVKRSSDINAQDILGKTALHLAAENCDLALMQLLIEHKAKVDILDLARACPLHSFCGSKAKNASRQEKECMLETLLEGKVDVNWKDAFGRTPLLLAAEADSNLLKVLIKHKAKTDISDTNKDTVFHYLARHKFQPFDKRVPVSKIFPETNADFSMVDMLIRNREDLNSKNVAGDTALHIAAANGNHDLAMELISHDAKVNILDKEGRSLLHKFCCRMPWSDKELTVRLFTRLRDEGADLNAQDRQGCTPLHLAAANHDLSSIEALLDLNAAPDVLNKKDELALHLYAMGNSRNPCACLRTDEIRRTERLLVTKTKKIDQQNHEKLTPLHCAAGTKKFSLMKSLLEEGADVDLVSTKGQTGLHAYANAPRGFWSSLKQQNELGQDVEELLLEQCTCLDSPDESGETPLHVAVKSGCWTIVKALLQNGARLDHTDKSGNLPLHLLASRCELEVAIQMAQDLIPRENIVSILFQVIAAERHSIKKERVRIATEVPVHESKETDYNHTQERACIENLLLSGTEDIDTKNALDQTPLHLAASCRNASLMEKLLERQANINALNHIKRTPLHCYASARLQIPSLVQGDAPLNACFPSTMQSQKMETSLVKNTRDINCRDCEGRTPLHLAVMSCSDSLVRTLLEHSAWADLEDCDNRLPVHIRALTLHNTGDPQVCDIQNLASLDSDKLLLQKTGDLNKKDKNGNTPLHLALALWNFPFAEMLLQGSASVNILNNAERSPLHKLARLPTDRYHQEEKQQAGGTLVAASKDERRQVSGRVLRNGCAEEPQDGLTELVRQLVLRSDDINCTDEMKRTALHWAADTRNFDLMEHLLRHGTRPDLQDADGRTVLHVYILAENDPLVNPGIGALDALFYSIAPRMRVDKLLVEKAGDVNTVDAQGRSPLHLAALKDDVHLMEALIDAGASCNLKTKEGVTALHLYAQKHESKIIVKLQNNDVQTIGQMTVNRVETLLVKGSKETMDSISKGQESTALHASSNNGNFSLLEKLLMENPDTGMKDANNRTALHQYAARPRVLETEEPPTIGPRPLDLYSNVRLRVDKLMVEKAADINELTNEGDTALHLAARNDDLSLIEQLLQHGARTDLQNQAGQLALHDFASRRRADSELFRERRRPVSKLLVEKTANVNVKDKEGRRPLDLAKKHEDFLLAQLLSDHDEA